MAEPALVELVERTIASLAVEIQARCDRDVVLRKLGSLGAVRVEDLKLLLHGDITMVTAALHPVPILLAFKLKEALGPSASSPSTASPSAFQTHDNVCFNCALLVALMERRTPFGVTGAQLMFEPYYRQLRGVASLVPSPFGLGALLATKSLKLVEPESFTARALPAVAKCAKCKSAEGELRACSFCKSGIYHDTAECLGEVRGPEASFTHKAFPWCCPKCFKRGKAALEKQLLAPVHTTGNKRKR